MENALRIIISKSPAAMSEAIKTIRAIQAGSPIVQQRYNSVVDIALADPESEFTGAERAEIAEWVSVPESESRDFVLHVRLTDSERAELQSRADEVDLKLSEYVRRVLFG